MGIKEFFYPEGQSGFGSAYLGLIVTHGQISSTNILKGCSSGLSELTL